MAGILIYSENEKLALELLGGARALAADLGCAVKAIAINNQALAETLAGAGAEVFHMAVESFGLYDTAAVAHALADAAEKLEGQIILLASNHRGKELAGRLAQAVGAGCITDATRVVASGGRIECQRNALGGATVAVQYMETGRQVIAVMPKTFEAATGEGAGNVIPLEVKARPSGVRLVEVKPKAGDTVDIEAAGVLVAVGQGLASQDDLPMVEALARALGGEVACSKPVATDKKWLPEERIIGLSGKKCKPALAVLLGISGQVQFTVGIRDARTIVAVNSDENAYIFNMADYGIVGDIYDVLPALTRALS